MKLFRFPHFDQGGDLSSQEYESKWSLPQEEWFILYNKNKRLALQGYLKELGYTQPNFQGIDLKFFVDKSLMKGLDVRCTFDQMEYFLGEKNAHYGMDKEESIIGRIDEDVPYEGRSE